MTGFSLGKISVSFAAATALRITNTHLLDLLSRHTLGDSGDAPEAATKVLERQEQVISVYQLPDSKLVVWVVTEPDLSATSVLLEGEDHGAV